jgi:hypothetical protein
VLGLDAGVEAVECGVDGVPAGCVGGHQPT